MAGKAQTVTGRIMWAKILGEPVNNYDGDAREWVFDLEPDEASTNKLNKLGLGARIKTKEDREPFIQFRRREFKRSGPNEGEPNNPISVIDTSKKPWDEEKLIGNGSTVNVSFGIYDVPARGNKPASKNVTPYEVMVTDYVEYKPGNKGNSPRPAGTFKPIEEDFSSKVNDVV